MWLHKIRFRLFRSVRVPFSLDFDASHHYPDAIGGIDVPIVLCIGRQSVELLAKLDTGAAHRIFERKYAEMLGVDVRLSPASTFPRPWLDRLPPINTRSQFRRRAPSSRRSPSSPKIQRSAETSSAGPAGLTALRIAMVDYDRTLFLSPYQS